MAKILIYVSFGERSRTIKLLEDSGSQFVMNPLGRRVSEEELFDLVDDVDAIIAGTEKISKKIIEKSRSLRSSPGLALV